jgi:DNA-binding MarR family transcriptional regulator
VTHPAAPADVPDSPPRRSVPTRAQLASWRTFLRAHALVNRALEAELVAEQQLSLAAYDVLVQLYEAPGHRLRMTELADAVLLSRSGVTRLVDRLEKSGLVSRCPVAGDGRGVAAELTETGANRLRTASRTHLTGVMRHFVEPLGDDLGALEQISRRLVD